VISHHTPRTAIIRDNVIDYFPSYLGTDYETTGSPAVIQITGGHEHEHNGPHSICPNSTRQGSLGITYEWPDIAHFVRNPTLWT
jgi:hypothetical protein